MSHRPHSRAMDPACAARIAALTALGIELRTIANHAEVSESTFRRVRGGQVVVRAVARSVELAVDDLTRRHAPAPDGPQER